MILDNIELKRAYEVSVKGLCYDEQGQLLLIKDKDGDWELPGGGLDHGEDFQQCLKRECQEELGVGCEVIDQDPYKVWVGTTNKEVLRLIILFRIKLKSHDFSTRNLQEAEEVRYINRSELANLKLVRQLEKLKELI